MLKRTLYFIASHPLSEGRVLRNLARFCVWQAVSRIWPYPLSFELVQGARMFAARGLHGATGNLYLGLHEAEEMGFVLHVLRQGDAFCDVGANVGSYTVLAMSRGATVYAFEPGSAAINWLRRNIELNAANGRAHAHQIALSDHSGTAAFISTRDTENRLSDDGDTTVPVTTMDKATEGERPALIKIDVEDGGQGVLAGAFETLRNPDLLAVVGELTGYAAVALLAQHGFAPYSYDLVSRTLSPLPDVSHRGNAIFIRDFPHVSERVKTAPPFSIRGRAY
jgi:FkbM family methyltransferase